MRLKMRLAEAPAVELIHAVPAEVATPYTRLPRSDSQGSHEGALHAAPVAIPAVLGNLSESRDPY